MVWNGLQCLATWIILSRNPSLCCNSDMVRNTEKHMCMLMYSDSLLDTQRCMIQFQRTTTDDRGEEEKGRKRVSGLIGWSFFMTPTINTAFPIHRLYLGPAQS